MRVNVVNELEPCYCAQRRMYLVYPPNKRPFLISCLLVVEPFEAFRQ